MNKAVIFDLDGTLLDTIPDIADSVNQTLKHFGAPTVDYEFVRKAVGNGARKLIERCFGDGFSKEEIDERLDYYNRLYTDSGSPKTCVYDGMGEVLIQLKKRGYKLGILTNKPQMTTDDVYETYLKQYSFDVVVGFKQGVKVKPDPTVLNQMLADLDVLPKNAYFVGDGETDVEVSINANVNNVTVLWGNRDKDELSNAGAKVFAENPEQLLMLIE